MSTDCGIPNTTNQKRLFTENCRGVKSAEGAISAPTIAKAFAGFLRYTRSKYFATNGNIGSAATPRRLRSKPRSNAPVTCNVFSR